MPSVSLLDSSPSQEIEVIVVGCGFAGLACAIECKRKGHNVIVLEKRSSLDNLGDVISFAVNTGRIFERWGLSEQLLAVCCQHPCVHMHNHEGVLINTQPLPQKLYGFNSYNGRRGEIHEILLSYAKKIGVDVRFGQTVEDYWESTSLGRAGAIVNGERLEADIIVGADGARSRAREIVLGVDDKTQASGYAIYRAWFNAKEHGFDTDPLTSWLCNDGEYFAGWVGQDLHMFAMSFHGGDEICWLLTHRDEKDITESWSNEAKISDVLNFIQDWEPRAKAIVAKTPSGSCIDWKLVKRDPLPTWVSEGGRIVVIGDAAHACPPTSTQGASQGIEDGVALAVTLRLAGKKNVPLGTRTFEHIRYERATQCQIMGEKVRKDFHKKPEEREEGEKVAMAFPEWLLNHDAEKHTANAYEQVSQHILAKGYRKPSEVQYRIPVSDTTQVYYTPIDRHTLLV